MASKNPNILYSKQPESVGLAISLEAVETTEGSLGIENDEVNDIVGETLLVREGCVALFQFG